MDYLKSLPLNLIIGLNSFILFFLLFEDRIATPPLIVSVGRLHPLVLHFPIVLILLAVLFEVFRKKFPWEDSVSEILVHFFLYAGAIMVAFTVIFGLFLSREEGYSGRLLDYHKWLGVATCWLTAGLCGFYDRLSRKTAVTAMVILSFTLIGAGHFGAAITHGENFITEPVFPEKTIAPDLTKAIIFSDLVAPVLKEKCINCHNPDKAKGGLVLSDTAAILKGGENGRLFEAGNSARSLLTERLMLDINHKHRMPPKGKPQLSDAEIGLLRAWIDDGAGFHTSLASSQQSETITNFAESIYGKKEAVAYDFPAANPDLVTSLATSSVLIAPVSYNSPALNVSFFGRSTFNRKSLENLVQLKEQIISLNLAGMPVGDSEMILVAPLTNLRELNLNQTEITDKSIEVLKKLVKLEVLKLTGTNLSAAAFSAIAQLPELKRVYAWNTGLDQKEAARIGKKNLFDIGPTEKDSSELQLNTPYFVPSNSFFREPFELELRHPVFGTSIRYTLDGTVPDSVKSPIREKPILIAQNTVVKARAFKSGWAGSETTEKNFQRSAIVPDSYSLLTHPSPIHKGNGVKSLFDLQDGSPDILYASDGKWLGYQSDPFVAELKFSKSVEIREILLSTLTSVMLDAFPPSLVEIWSYSSSGDSVLIAKNQPAQPEKSARIEKKMIRIPFPAGTNFDHLRIVVQPNAKMPAWHPRHSQRGWFFIDEILIN